MRSKNMNRYVSRLIALSAGAALAPFALAGAYIGADADDLDIVTHPSNYTGSGGTLTVRVCISPASSMTAALEIPVQNVIARMNSLEPTIGNLITGGANDIPSGAIDAESALLHETGHCIGLAHPNLATESGVPSAQRDYTKSTRGANNAYNLNDGADNVLGSGDDLRGDDINLHWFRRLNNDPFTIADVIDSTTYARDQSLLPGGDSFAANASRQLSSLLGLPATEAAMQQGQGFDEDQRRLGHDDVATLRYGASGVDEVAGTADDYTIALQYQGITNTGCDVTVSVDGNTGFASCSVGLAFVGGGDHLRITSGTVRLNNQTNWYYNQTPTFDPPNEPPVLGFIEDQIVIAGEALVLPIDATDPNTGDVLSFGLIGEPSFCQLLDNDDGTGSVNCFTTAGDEGNYAPQVFVFDDAGTPLSDSQVFTLEVVSPVGDSDGDGVTDDVDNCINVPNEDQRDTNGDGYGNICDADINGDCVANVVDLGVLRTVFFTDDEDADFNGDGVVNVLDLGILRTQFFAAPGPSGISSVCD